MPLQLHQALFLLVVLTFSLYSNNAPGHSVDALSTRLSRSINMNLRNYDYSLKNIPVPSNHTYLKCLTDKVDHFIRRMRWKSFWFTRKHKNDSDHDDDDDDNSNISH